MNKTKFLFISIIILALIFLVGYMFLNRRCRKVETFLIISFYRFSTIKFRLVPLEKI